jgi:anti-sigma regulatory factor (Ser/Thr protein kinase)
VLETERANAAANDAIAKMAQNLSHDLKNHLIVFELATRSTTWPDFFRFRDQMARSLTTIHAILTGFGKNKNSETVIPRVCNLDIEAIIGNLTRIQSDNTFHLKFTGIGLVTALIDSVALERAIGNLIRNAKEAGASEVVVNASGSDSSLNISVIDNGPGLPEELTQMLFQRGATYGKAGGSGLGLFNVQTIMEAHRGSVEYQRDKGLTYFILSFPHAIIGANVSHIQPQRTTQESETSDKAAAGVMVRLHDRSKQQNIEIHLRNSGSIVAKDDDASPLMLYTDIDEYAEKFKRSKVRIVYADSDLPVERQIKLILLVYRTCC